MYKVITICGPMKFRDEMLEVQKTLSFEGNIVLLPSFSMDDLHQDLDSEVKGQFTLMHFQRIDMADEIFVVNVGGYMGEHTKIEIEYAQICGKPITYLEDLAEIT